MIHLATPRSPALAAHARRGSALSAALMVVTLMSMLSAALLQMTAQLSRQQVSSVDNIRAFYMAEAGLSEGIYGLRAGFGGNVGSQEYPVAYGDGLFWVEATDQGAGRTLLESTGLVGVGRFALAATAEHKDSVAARGLFAQDSLTVGAGSTIDSFSSLTSLVGGLFLPAQKAKVGSNGPITLNGSLLRGLTTVLGDVRPGPGHSVSWGLGVLVIGTSAPATETLEMPPIKLPSLPSAGALTVAAGAPVTLSDVATSYTNLHVASGGRLTIHGPATIVADSLQLASSAQLDVRSLTGPVHIYVKDELALLSGSGINTMSKDAAGFSLLVAAQQGSDPAPVMQSTTSFYGTIYAPYTAISLPSQFQVYGALSAKAITLANGSRFHYDSVLDSAPSWDSAPELSGWHVAPLPPELLADRLLEPRALLGLEGYELYSPSQGHEMNGLLEIIFSDVLGIRRRYTGDPAKFDRGLIGAVVAEVTRPPKPAPTR
jgi:hypothetical protein